MIFLNLLTNLIWENSGRILNLLNSNNGTFNLSLKEVEMKLREKVNLDKKKSHTGKKKQERAVV